MGQGSKSYSEAERAAAVQAIKTANEIRDQIIWPEREKHSKAQRWQELAVCEQFADAITAKIKGIRKEFDIL